MIDSLEHRFLLFAQVVDGVLRVEGTSGNDTIAVALVVGPIELVTVERNGQTRTFQRSELTGVHINARKGNDQVALNVDLPGLLIGGPGNDTLASREGNDTLRGGAGHDMLQAEFGSDQLDGGCGNDQLFGGDGPDLLIGGAGDDQINAGPGNDLLLGGRGNDTLDADDADLGRDTVSGGRGFDTAFIDDVAIYGNTDTVLPDVEVVS